MSFLKAYISIIQLLLNKKVWVPGLLMYFFDKATWQSKGNLDLAIFGMNPDTLVRLAQKKLLWVFKDSLNTPALIEFYDKNKIQIEEIKTIEDFTKKVPETTKENYILQYSLEDRCRGGQLPRQGIVFKSAGVYGERTYWTQSLKEEDRFSVFVPFGLEYLFGYSKKNYHVINCWAFGTWPTAIDFTKAARECGRMINIGPNIEETIETLKKLGSSHSYLISGYPPYLRSLIYRGAQEGLDWKKYNIDILTGGEGFVEEWRDLIRAKLHADSLVISAYGSTDKGLGEGIETPLTIAIRNLIRILQFAQVDKNRAMWISKKVFSKDILIPTPSKVNSFFLNVFGKSVNSEFRTPMLFQSDPLTYFQENTSKVVNGIKMNEVVTTNLKTYSSQPVIRYNIQDESGSVGYNEMIKQIESLGFNIFDLVKGLPLNDPRPLPYPFFYVFGRTSGMLSLDGANIFPEEVGRMIEFLPIGEQVNSFRLKISEKYILVIELELKKDSTAQDGVKLKDQIKEELIKFSPGFAAISAENLPSSDLIVELHQFGTGPFVVSPSLNPNIVKYQYVGTKVFGRH